MKKRKYWKWTILGLLSLSGLFMGVYIFTQACVSKWNSVANCKFKNISLQSQNKILSPGYNGSNSYRIPSLIKTSGKNLLVFANQRKTDAKDPPSGEINIYQKSSKDLGQTWDAGRVIIHIKDNLNKNHSQRASVVDQAVTYSHYNHTTYLIADVWPRGSGLSTGSPVFFNPINTNKDHAELGFTPDHKYWKFFHKKELKKKYVLAPVKTAVDGDKNDNWLQAYQLKDNLWTNTAATNLEATKTYVNNSFDPITGNLHGDVYANVTNFKEFKTNLTQKNNSEPHKSKLVGNIWAGGNPHNNFSNYYVESYPYIYLFKSVDNGVNWSLMGNITNQVGPWKNGFDGNNILVGPGRGLVLSRQKNSQLNGRILFPFYENYNAKGRTNLRYAYVAYSDDAGITWKTSNYINDKKNYFDNGINWKYATETQLVETNNGTIYAFMRSNGGGFMMVAKSEDGGISYTNLDNNSPDVSLILNNNISSTMSPGVVSANIGKDNYVFYSQASRTQRTHGVLFGFLNGDFNYGKLLWNYANYEPYEPNKSFVYSSLEILSIHSKQIILGSLYEVADHYQWNTKRETEISGHGNFGFIFSTFKINLS